MNDNEFVWLTPMSQQFLRPDYIAEDETVSDRVKVIGNTAEKILGEEFAGFSNKFQEYMKLGFYSLSTPIWINFGTDRGLPISCFGSMIEDSMISILSTQAEVGMMTKFGGGTSGYFGKLRGRGSTIRNNGKSSGAVHFMNLFESTINVVSQGSTRRGSFAAYLDINHPDIEEFLLIRTESSQLQDISTGVCVDDAFMNAVIDGDRDKRRIWAKLLEARSRTGYPYIFFTDNVNKTKPSWYENYAIMHSNLCSEIMLPNNENESFVCDLSSMNIYHYNQWKHTDAVQTLTYLLDAVMTEFIEKASVIPYLGRAVTFAERHRALGIGWLGWHSYLQKALIPFESMEAKFVNIEIAKFIQSESKSASVVLANRLGEPEVMRGTGLRNSTLQAIAPTKSSAFILGQVSEGIEPHRSNYYVKDLAKGKFTIRNLELQKVLSGKDKDNDEVWNSILNNHGSIQHLEFLDDNEKAVFKTFAEISPKEIIIQAAARQNFIDQGQSLNLMIPATTPLKEINALVIEAWKLGIKALYYQINLNAAQETTKSILECVSCSS